jgi:hypothetical protein
MRNNITISIAGKEFSFADSTCKISDITNAEWESMLQIIGNFSIKDILNLVISKSKEDKFNFWRTELENTHRNLDRSKAEEGKSFVSHWNRILNEYIDWNYVREFGQPFAGTKPFLFDIDSMYSNLKTRENKKLELAKRLVDLKLYYSFLWLQKNTGHGGSFQIVGNNELYKITPEAMHWLRGLSCVVFFISALIEKLINFSEYTCFTKVQDGCKDGTKERIKNASTFLNFTENDQHLLVTFRDKFRNGEFHKLSSIRAFTNSPKWNHFDAEKEIIDKTVENLFKKISGPDFQNHITQSYLSPKHKTPPE